MSPQTTQLTLDQKAFDPSSISPETKAFNQKLIDIMATGPKWYEVGAPAYREMRRTGKTPFPAATLLPNAITFSIPSRDPGRDIPCRIVKPTNNNNNNDNPVKSILMHIHGGGWVLQDETSFDPYLQAIANKTSTLVISIGYRLAPEHVFPAGPEDCFDAAEWLIQNSSASSSSSSSSISNGATLGFICGESAGGHLSMLTALHLLNHPDPTFSSNFTLRGLLFHFGCFDLSFTPHVFHFQGTKNPRTKDVLVLDWDIMQKYVEAFLPEHLRADAENLKRADVSPMYANLGHLREKLPPALFTCGTEDPLLDDTVFMSTRWLMSGAETVVRIVPGGVHGYIFFLGVEGSGSSVGIDAMEDFVNSKL